jgi:hypothetical protein
MTEPEQKPKKKRINSKSKGNGFENTVAKKLTAALDPLKFIRTPGSGARVGGKNFAAFGEMFGADALKLYVGDVVPTNERDTGLKFKYSIETKFYKTPDNFTALVSGKANVYGWFKESIVDCVKINKQPCLIFKWNNTPIFVAVLHQSSSIPPRFTLKTDVEMDVYELEDILYSKEFWIE